MKQPIRSLLAVVALAVLGGCASSRSPLQPANTSPVSAGGGTMLTTSAAIGAAAGAMLAPNKNKIGGSAVGGGVGLITGALIGNRHKAQAAQVEAEAYERGRRDARVEVMRKYWHDQTLSPRDEPESGGTRAARAIEYPPGVYEGIKYGPRTTIAPTLGEPRR